MWATAGNTYSEKEGRSYGSSMKWHLVDESSLEVREIEIGWNTPKRKVNKIFGYLDCGRKGRSHHEHSFDYKMVLVLKEKININQSNVCGYCRKARKRELGIEDKLEA